MQVFADTRKSVQIAQASSARARVLNALFKNTQSLSGQAACRRQCRGPCMAMRPWRTAQMPYFPVQSQIIYLNETEVESWEEAMVRRARSAGDDEIDEVAGVQPEDTDLGDAIRYIYR